MRSWTRRRKGITLVEVLAGSALLGTLLVSILVADGRLKLQGRSAGAHIEACGLADEQLERFFASKEGVPPEGSGDLAGHEGWRWRTRRVETDCAPAPDAEIVALDVFGPGKADSPPTVTVQILVGRPDNETASGVYAH